MDCLFPIVFTYVINQSHEHWLLSDALHIIILMNLQLKEKNQVVPSFENIMDDDSIVADELVLLASNFRREVCGMLNSFLSFLTKCENKNTHNTIFLMLNPRFKNLYIIFSFVGKEQGVVRNIIGSSYILCWSNVMNIYIPW